MYLCVLFASRFVLLDLLLFKYGFSSVSAVGYACVGVGVLYVGKMKRLSERFQLDFWKTHQH